MPPRVAKLPANVLFEGTAGDHRKLDAVFRKSLVTEGPLLVDPANWILTVLPSLSPASITLRLLIFVFVPAFVLADDLDQAEGVVLFYPSLLSVSRLLHRLLKEGMSSETVPDVRSMRARVLAAASLLPVASRALTRANVVVVNTPPPCVLAPMSPLMFRGADEHNGALATFLATLPGYFTGITRGLMPAALASLVPPSVSAADPPSLVALTVVSHIRESQPAAPFDSYLSFSELLPELMRMRLPSGEARFIPLFNRDWQRAFPILPRLFRNVVSPTEIRQHLHTLAVALRIPFDAFSEPAIRGLCITVGHLATELEVELPLSTHPSPDELIAALVRLARRAGYDSSAATSSGADVSGRSMHQGGSEDAGYSKLLALPAFIDLYEQVVALNTTGFHASQAIALALSHPHPAALIVMVTTKTLPQPGWSSIIGGMRQKTSWPNVFDKALAVDADGEVAHDWGVMLPVDAKGNATMVNHLVTGKLQLVTDWWMALTKWVGLHVGTHVLALPEYASTADPLDFWLSAARMRLVSPAMYAIFAVIAHDHSRSTPGSFREWYELHITRVTRIMHLPHSTPAYVATVNDCRSAVLMLFKEHDEVFATMIGRPFHEARRPIFLDPQRACYKSFQALDSELSKLQLQIALAVKGRATHQAPHLQFMTPPPLPFPSSSYQAPPALGAHLGASSSSDALAVPAVPAGSRTGTSRSPQTQQHGAAAFPADIYDGWGPKAIRHGVWLNTEGLVFGNTQCHAAKPVTFAKGTCGAALASNGTAKARSQWCLTPSLCKALGYAAHERPAGTTDDDFSFTEIDKDVDRSSWSVVVTVIPDLPRNPPAPPWSIFLGPGSKPGDKRQQPGARNSNDKRKANAGKDKGAKKANFDGQLKQRKATSSPVGSSAKNVRAVPASAGRASADKAHPR